MLLLWSSIIAGVGELVLGVLILIKAKKKSQNYFFALLSLLLGLIVIFNYLSLTSLHSEVITLLWIRVVMFLVPLLIFFLYYFARSYSNKDFSFNRLNFWLLFVVTCGIALFNFSPYVYQSVSIIQETQIVPETGPGIILNAFFILPLFILAIINMLNNAKSADKESSLKIKFALYLFLLSFGVQIITSFVVVAVFNYTRLIFLGNFLTLFFAIAITASILRLKMFAINVISSVVFAIIMVVLMFAEIFTASNSQELIYRIVVFVAVVFVAYQFVQSIRVETQQKKELKKLTEKLRKANNRLKKLDAMKTEFVSVASHELLTPISAIKGYLSMILDEEIINIKDKKAVDYLDRIYASAKRLSKLVKDLLNVSRIEQGRLSFDKKEFGPKNIAEEIQRELKLKAKKKDAKIILDDLTEIKGYGDIDKIKEVLVNLVGNSIKFTPKKGKIVISAEVWKSDRIKKRYDQMINLGERAEKIESQLPNYPKTVGLVGDKQIVFKVKDDGIGIKKKDIEKLFSKFSRIENWQRHHTQGTGLGLYISKTIILMHYGKIWAESEGGNQGSTFYFSIPLAENKKEVDTYDKKIPQAENGKPLAKAGSKKI